MEKDTNYHQIYFNLDITYSDGIQVILNICNPIFSWIAGEEYLGVKVHHSRHKHIIQGTHIHPRSNGAGYWGPPSANIDWCEDNYVATTMIAEFWNSFSSFALVSAGFVAYLRELKQYTEQPSLSFAYAYIATTFVGIGSFLFHATLLWSMQIMDELPMVYAALGFMVLFLTVEDTPNKKTGHDYLWIFVLGYAVFSTALEIFLPQHPEIFQLMFLFVFLGNVFKGVQLYSVTSEESKSSFAYGFISFLIGSTFWVFIFSLTFVVVRAFCL